MLPCSIVWRGWKYGSPCRICTDAEAGYITSCSYEARLLEGLAIDSCERCCRRIQKLLSSSQPSYSLSTRVEDEVDSCCDLILMLCRTTIAKMMGCLAVFPTV